MLVLSHQDSSPFWFKVEKKIEFLEIFVGLSECRDEKNSKNMNMTFPFKSSKVVIRRLTSF